MSQLQILIQTLCPEGVEYKTLETVCELSRGKVYSKTYIAANAGNYPVYSSQTANNGELGRISTYDYDGEYLTWTTDGAYAGTIFHRKGKFSITNVCGLIAIKSPDILNIRFLYYWLSIKAQEYVYRGMGNPKLMSNQMATIEIPMPPLTVQEEIVRILDLFTNLAAELQAELQARQKQYEHYRNKLLTFEKDAEGMEWKRLPDICENLDRRRKPVTASNRTFGPYPYYGASGIVDYVSSYIFDGNYLLISEDGANLLARNTPIAFSISGKNWVNNHAHVLKFQNMFTQKYIEYYINMIDVSQYVSGGAQPKLNQENLNKILIPIPPLPEQQRIVSILDKFETLVNDLSQGLPAEIAAVQEQYEYYRNKLLLFSKNKISA